MTLLAVYRCNRKGNNIRIRHVMQVIRNQSQVARDLPHLNNSTCAHCTVGLKFVPKVSYSLAQYIAV